MADKEAIYSNIVRILDYNQAQYKLFSHTPVLSYKDSAEVQKESGFIGTEGKCLVVRIKDGFVVCITIQGIKLNFSKLKEILNDKDIRLATPEELREYFGAEPGRACPFGFDESINIYIDPKIYSQEWFLFSPLFPTKTIQVKGSDLRQIFSNLKNKTQESANIFL